MKIGIIGAGVAGLSAAWDLLKAGHEVRIFEAGDAVGGLASGFRDETWNWSLEKFYHHWFESDSHVLQLAHELGVRDRLDFRRAKTSYWIDGKLWRSEISPSALFLPLSPLAKLQFGLAGAFIKLTPFWKPLERVTAHSWLMRYMGAPGYEKFFRPLLIGKFGVDYDKVNMAWMWARVKARTLKLGNFQGGFQAFLEALAEGVRQRGGQIALNSPVERIDLEGANPALTVGGERIIFDRVLSTTSPSLLLKLAPRLQNTSYGDQVRELESIGGLCVVVALKQQLLSDGTYWLNLPADSPERRKNRFPFLALVEHTNLFDRADYGGDHLIYMGDYVPAEHEYFRMSEEQLFERFAAALPTFNPAFKPDWVRRFWVFRAPYAQPMPFLNHSERIPPLATPLPGLYWASMSQVYPWDRGTNFAVEIGRRAAVQMMR
ncbi:MAG: NAD(P)/FAD-dependent oxidoreductase [Anaerolineae bacterium]|nr:NAD(P)/FAD-dependent oxidoreductase [Anaerolineae bacterium]